MAQDQFVPAQQDRAAALLRHPSPGLECAVRGADRCFYLRAIQHRDVTDDLLVGGILHGDGCGAVAMNPAAINITKRLEKDGMTQQHERLLIAVYDAYFRPRGRAFFLMWLDMCGVFSVIRVVLVGYFFGGCGVVLRLDGGSVLGLVVG